MTDKVALVTGVTGKDGACLAELLLDKGYIVRGVKRWSSRSMRTGSITLTVIHMRMARVPTATCWMCL